MTRAELFVDLLFVSAVAVVVSTVVVVVVVVVVKFDENSEPKKKIGVKKCFLAWLEKILLEQPRFRIHIVKLKLVLDVSAINVGP